MITRILRPRLVANMRSKQRCTARHRRGSCAPLRSRCCCRMRTLRWQVLRHDQAAARPGRGMDQPRHRARVDRSRQVLGLGGRPRHPQSVRRPDPAASQDARADAGRRAQLGHLERTAWSTRFTCDRRMVRRHAADRARLRVLLEARARSRARPRSTRASCSRSRTPRLQRRQVARAMRSACARSMT